MKEQPQSPYFKIAVALALFLCLAWAWPMLSHPFYQDDGKFLAAIRLGDSLSEYFRLDWGWVYRPLFLCYYALMLRLQSGPPSPAPFEAVAVTLHFLTCGLLGWLTYRLARAVSDNAQWVGLAVACASCVLLARTETLKGASCTSILFCAALSLAAIHSYLSWREGARWGAVCVVAFTVLALGFKEEAVMVPVVCALLDLFFLPTRKIELSKPLLLMTPFIVVFGVLSILSNHNNTPETAKIALVDKAFDPLAVSDFYLLALAQIFYTPARLLNVVIVAAIGFYVYQSKRREVRGAFWLSFIFCVPVPLMTGTYALTPERFYYFSSLFALMSVGVLACSVSLNAAFLCRHALILAAVAAGLVRNVISSSIEAQEFLQGNEFAPLALCLTLAVTAWLWRSNRLEWPVAVLLIAVMVGSQVEQGLITSTVCFLPLALCLSGAGILTHRVNGRWVLGVLVVAGLWAMPALTLPIALTTFCAFYYSAVRVIELGSPFGYPHPPKVGSRLPESWV